MSGYLVTLLTTPLHLNTHFFRKVRDQVKVSLSVSYTVRVRVRVKGA